MLLRRWDRSNPKNTVKAKDRKAQLDTRHISDTVNEPNPTEINLEEERKKPLSVFANLSVKELKEEARKIGLDGYSGLNKDELIDLLVGE